MTQMSFARIDPLLEDIEAQRQVVDARLSGPARWRGPLRRETRRGPRPEERARYATTFDDMVKAVAGGGAPVLDTDLLRRVHAGVFGGDGSFRGTEVRVGRFRTSAPAAAIPDLVATALTRAGDGEEPAVLASARLHMELLLIHPWSDGNGRAVRLLASLPLLTAGFKSTLFTAVEQHSSVSPRMYGRAFTLLRASRPTQHEPWLAANLQLMAWNSEFATAYRTREDAMRAALADAGVDSVEHDRILVDHDTGQASHAVLARSFPSLTDLTAAMHSDKRAAFARQVERLVAEEHA